MFVFIVHSYLGDDVKVVKVYATEQAAKNYCEQMEVNSPMYPHYDYTKMAVEAE